jgi:hypothetical protein
MNGKAWQGRGALNGLVMKKAGFSYGLFTLMFVLLMTGCAHEQPALSQADVKDLVHKEISDPVRADKVVALMEQMNAEISDQMNAKVEFRKDFAKLNTDYYATPEQFEQFMESTREAQDKNRARIMETYFRIKDLTTPQEWEALCKPEMLNFTDYLQKMEESSKK